MEEEIKKHEHLREEEYYEARSVSKGRTDKWCEHCCKKIAKGTAHEMHHFYPDFYAYATHKECSEAFIKSLN